MIRMEQIVPGVGIGHICGQELWHLPFEGYTLIHPKGVVPGLSQGTSVGRTFGCFLLREGTTSIDLKGVV